MKKIFYILLLIAISSITALAQQQIERYTTWSAASQAAQGKHNARFYPCRTGESQDRCIARWGNGKNYEDANSFFTNLGRNSPYCGGCYIVYEVTTTTQTAAIEQTTTQTTRTDWGGLLRETIGNGFQALPYLFQQRGGYDSGYYLQQSIVVERTYLERPYQQPAQAQPINIVIDNNNSIVVRPVVTTPTRPTKPYCLPTSVGSGNGSGLVFTNPTSTGSPIGDTGTTAPVYNRGPLYSNVDPASDRSAARALARAAAKTAAPVAAPTAPVNTGGRAAYAALRAPAPTAAPATTSPVRNMGRTQVQPAAQSFQLEAPDRPATPATPRVAATRQPASMYPIRTASVAPAPARNPVVRQPAAPIQRMAPVMRQPAPVRQMAPVQQRAPMQMARVQPQVMQRPVMAQRQQAPAQMRPAMPRQQMQKRSR